MRCKSATKGSVASLELRRSLAIASAKLDRHRAEQAENEAVQQNNPATRSTFARLAFAHHMDRFVTGDRPPSSPERAKMLACTYPALDRPMILFQDVIEILHRSMPAIILQRLRGFEPHDGRWITGVLVGVDHPRCRMALSAQGLGQKALGRCCVAFRKSMLAPVESTARYK